METEEQVSVLAKIKLDRQAINILVVHTLKQDKIAISNLTITAMKEASKGKKKLVDKFPLLFNEGPSEGMRGYAHHPYELKKSHQRKEWAHPTVFDRADAKGNPEIPRCRLPA